MRENHSPSQLARAPTLTQVSARRDQPLGNPALGRNAVLWGGWVGVGCERGGQREKGKRE